MLDQRRRCINDIQMFVFTGIFPKYTIVYVRLNKTAMYKASNISFGILISSLLRKFT